MTNFVVYVDSVVNVTSSSPVCYDYPSDGSVAVSSGQPMSLRCRNSRMNGRYITISAQNSTGNSTLVLCEVYVFTNSGKYSRSFVRHAVYIENKIQFRSRLIDLTQREDLHEYLCFYTHFHPAPVPMVNSYPTADKNSCLEPLKNWY